MSQDLAKNVNKFIKLQKEAMKLTLNLSDYQREAFKRPCVNDKGELDIPQNVKDEIAKRQALIDEKMKEIEEISNQI